MSLEAQWKRVSDWLAKTHPAALKTFRKPATAAAIAKAEKALGRLLPDDYKVFLAIHDGQEPDGPMVEWATLLPVDQIAVTYKRLVKLDPGEDDEFEADKKVKPVFYSKGWIPIGCSPRGRDFLCLDFDPAKGGKAGQVILFVIDFNERFQVAPSFAELWGVFLKDAKAGEIEF
jgi:cell wall assembly regulator SMI1